MVGDRAYFVALPETSGKESISAVVYIHGWGGSGAGALRNAGMVSALLERGFAVIAPDGVPREGRRGRSWRFHPVTGQQEAEPRHCLLLLGPHWLKRVCRREICPGGI